MLMDKESSQVVINTLQVLQNNLLESQTTLLNIQKFIKGKFDDTLLENTKSVSEKS